MRPRHNQITKQKEGRNMSAAKAVVGSKAFDVTVIVASLGALGLEAGPDINEKIAVLRGYFAEQAKGEDRGKLGVCDACKESSDVERFDACPFCGTIEPAPSEDNGAAATAEAPTGLIKTTKNKGAPLVGVLVTDFDRKIEEARTIQRGTMAGSWLLGTVLAEIDAKRLWKQKLNDEGKVKYKTFDAACKGELGMGRKNVTNLLRVVEHFTKDEVEKFGATKLRLLVDETPSTKKQMLEKMKGGAGRREVERALRPKTKAVDTLGAKNGKKKAAALKEGEGLLTLSTKDRKPKIHLFAGGKKGLGSGKIAKRVADDPYGYVDLANDVRIYAELTTTAAGGFVIQLEFRREAAAE
jgi:hypothetical protein